MAAPSNEAPMEIVTDILLRLPIKDILRSKCVAKAWCRLISSPHFVKLHLSRTLHRVPDSGAGSEPERRVVLAGGTSLQVVELDSLARTCQIDYPRGFSPANFLVGSCNGLICICSRTNLDILLINPATRSRRVVCRVEPSFFTHNTCLGFVYDSQTDDYKIILVSTRRPGVRAVNAMLKREIRIFSMRTNSWRLHSQETTELEVRPHGAFAEGKMHWFSMKPGGEDKGKIMSFIVEDERVEEVPIPPHYGDMVHYPKEIGAMEGKLCFLTEANRGGFMFYIDVWMMKEYGVARSWTKLYSVWCMSLPYPVASLRGGNEVLACEDGALFCYNRYEQRKRGVEIHGAGNFTEAVVSIGSLVPVTPME